VHLLEADEARMGDVLLAEYTILEARPPGFRFVKNGGDRCAALDCTTPGLFPCRIYERRPDDCRLVEPGSPSCLETCRLGRLGRSVEYRR